ncbi:MAG: class II aldolase/adducin family protein [Beijerinckiaceae bacterium]
MSRSAIRDKIVRAAREINALGINQGTAGNISVRDADAMLITPSGIPYATMTPDMIAAVSLLEADLAFEGPHQPSTEWRFHRDIFRARGDVNAVVHTHPLYATTLSVLRRDIPAVHYMIAAFGDSKIRCTDYAPYGTAELSQLAVAGLGRAHGVLLGNHGAIVTGAGLDKALWRAVELEALAKIYYLATLAGTPVVLPDDEIARTIERFKNYGLKAPRDS